jgi:hypothetical protein
MSAQSLENYQQERNGRAGQATRCGGAKRTTSRSRIAQHLSASGSEDERQGNSNCDSPSQGHIRTFLWSG